MLEEASPVPRGGRGAAPELDELEHLAAGQSGPMWNSAERCNWRARTTLTFYDASYLWLAQDRGADLVSLDAQLVRVGTHVSGCTHRRRRYRSYHAALAQLIDLLG